MLFVVDHLVVLLLVILLEIEAANGVVPLKVVYGLYASSALPIVTLASFTKSTLGKFLVVKLPTIELPSEK